MNVDAESKLKENLYPMNVVQANDVGEDVDLVWI